MGVMTRLRENTGVILWILVFAFGVIWVLQSSGGLDDPLNPGTNIAVVNGDPVTLEEYNNRVQQQVQAYQNQLGESMPPQMLDQTRDRVFDALVEERLREQEMDRLGLDVADEEVVQMIQGPNPHPLITSNFGDGEGGVDYALLQNFIDNPAAAQNWISIENFLRGERRRAKLNQLIASTVRISERDVYEEYERQHANVNTRYVALRFTALPDDSISYEDADLRRFYNDHKEEFARNRTYSLSYVSASKAPTSSDTSAVFRDLEGMKASFVSAEDDSLFLARNGSERPYTDAYFRPDELDSDVSTVVFADPQIGQVIGPFVSAGQVHLVKVLDVRPPEEPAVKASHILFRAAEGDVEARTAARQEALDVLAQARSGEDFGDLARAHSDDGSASRGGDLGWFGPGRMVAPFEEAAFDAPLGRVVGPVETQFGYHLIKVQEKASVEAKIADFALSLRASVSTLGTVQENLDDLAYFSSEEGDFAGEAARRNLNVLTVSLEAGQQFVPGVGNSRALATFLEDAKPGDVSPVIELNDAFLIATVDEIIPEGYRSFDEVRSEIEPRLRNKLKADIQRKRLQSAMDGAGFDGLADEVGALERTAEGLSYSNLVVPGIGRDPVFVGTAMGMKEGETSGVIEGANSVYVIQVTSKTNSGTVSPTDFDTIKNRLIQQRKSAVQNRWITTLKENADITDNRRLFVQ